MGMLYIHVYVPIYVHCLFSCLSFQNCLHANIIQQFKLYRSLKNELLLHAIQGGECSLMGGMDKR